MRTKGANNLITLDDVVAEKVRQEAKVLAYFNQYLPYETSEDIITTELQIIYDDDLILSICL